MSVLTPTLTVVLCGMVLRQGLVLVAIFRSCRFLLYGHSLDSDLCRDAKTTFYIVIHVLREAVVLQEAIDHFNVVCKRHDATVVVVTTAREEAERLRYPEAMDTLLVADELAKQGRCLHLHYTNPSGVKADQLNFAATYCASLAPTSQAFIVCYDADSRPLLDSLAHFKATIAQHPGIDVFHQSSRFELRKRASTSTNGSTCWLQKAIADAGALRANRFVLAYELPRLLNRSPGAGWLKRWLCSYVYSHVTGHGLCVRLSLLQTLPFPSGSPLEDMHYSFLLGSRNLAMQPIPSLDTAEVPSSLRIQLEQASRWFYGPGRFRSYLRDPATKVGWRARLLAASAFAISIEWLSCAILPFALGLVLIMTPTRNFLWALAAVFVALYAGQLVATNRIMGTGAGPAWRLARLAAYPISCTLFGISGVIGSLRLLRGVSSTGKTERHNQ